MKVARIISGGQTGGDRGGLDAAIACGIPHGGWCPKGRLAEDGEVPLVYCLQEHRSREYPPRTEKNVVDSDCTIIFTPTKVMGRGCLLTMRLCRKHFKPATWVNLFGLDDDWCADQVVFFLRDHPLLQGRDGLTVNVAGSRESHAPGLQARVKSIMTLALGRL